MSENAKTVEIPVMLQEARETGLITQEALDALEAEKALAKEKIANLKKSYREGIISHEQLEASIRGIREQMQRKILALNFDSIT